MDNHEQQPDKTGLRAVDISDSAPQAPPSQPGISPAYIVGIGCIIISVACVILSLGITGFDPIGRISALFNPPTNARVASTRTIVVNIQALGQLVTTNVQLAKADINVSVRQGVLNAASYSVSHVAEGEISAGISLTDMTEDDVSYDPETDTYTVALPAAQLTGCHVN